MRIAYFDEAGSYTHQAVLRYFGEGHELVPCKYKSDVFEEAGKKRCQFGVVPAENLKEGYVFETFDQLFATNITVCGEVEVKIKHCLVANPGTLITDITDIYSHSQALGQCKSFIRKHGFKEIAYGGTASSARFIAESKSTTAAAISSELAAKIHGLVVLKRGVADREKEIPNFTRFYVLSKNLKSVKQSLADKDDHTTLVFSIKDESGSLLKALTYFDKPKVDLNIIFPRPHPERTHWDKIIFHAECRSGLHEISMQQALKLLREHTESVKVTGSYRRVALKA